MTLPAAPPFRASCILHPASCILHLASYPLFVLFFQKVPLALLPFRIGRIFAALGPNRKLFRRFNYQVFKLPCQQPPTINSHHCCPTRPHPVSTPQHTSILGFLYSRPRTRARRVEGPATTFSRKPRYTRCPIPIATEQSTATQRKRGRSSNPSTILS